jgi:adenylate cyclase class 2
MSDREIEIRVKIENSANLLDFLAQNAQFQEESHQVDIYYCPPHRDFLSVEPIKEWLRLRDSNGKYSINYKSWHYEADGRSHYCDEYESPIESLDQLQKIFAAIDFKPIVEVDKLRRTWKYQDYEVAVDSVKNLGLTPAQIAEEMMDFLKGLNVGEIKRRFVGYSFMLLYGEEVKQAVG